MLRQSEFVALGSLRSPSFSPRGNIIIHCGELKGWWTNAVKARGHYVQQAAEGRREETEGEPQEMFHVQSAASLFFFFLSSPLLSARLLSPSPWNEMLEGPDGHRGLIRVCCCPPVLLVSFSSVSQKGGGGVCSLCAAGWGAAVFSSYSFLLFLLSFWL